MPEDRNVADAKSDLKTSVARLNEALDEVKKRRDAIPPPSFKEDGLLLKEQADLQAERTAEELLLNHLNAVAVEVSPPTAESGQALAKAIRDLDEMKRCTNELARFLDLCASFADSMDNHRREIDKRTKP